MPFSLWLLYVMVALIMAWTPGPDVLLAVTNSIAMGPKRVVFSTLGNLSGLFILSGAAMLGLGAVLKTSALLFLVVKILGAGYLIYMGIRQWRSRDNLFQQALPPGERPRQSRRRLFMGGFLLNLTNPKAILFFTALFPQFISVHRSFVEQFALLAGTLMAFNFCALMTYAMVAYSVQSWFQVPGRIRWFNRATGGLFIFLGAQLMRLRSV